MSNPGILFLTNSYGQANSLGQVETAVISFLTERGHQILNLKQFGLTAKSAVYEQTLALLKTSQLIVAVLSKPQALPLILLAQALVKQHTVIVFTDKEDLYENLRAVTNKQLHLYYRATTDSIINTLKLFQL